MRLSTRQKKGEGADEGASEEEVEDAEVPQESQVEEARASDAGQGQVEDEQPTETSTDAPADAAN